MNDADAFELLVPVRLACGLEVDVPLAFCDDLFYLDLLDQLVRAVRGNEDDEGNGINRKCARLVQTLSDYVDPGAAIDRARKSMKPSLPRCKARWPRG